MQFQRIFGRTTNVASAMEDLVIGSRRMPLVLVRNPRARRYLLRLRRDGTARVTVPRGGSLVAARQFVERHTAWLEREFARLQEQPRVLVAWQVGTEILFRGDPVRIEAGEPGWIRFGSELLRVENPNANLRPAIEHHLRELAARELPVRIMEFAVQHGLTVRQVAVRNQRTRWGSCSRRGTISLNWRLIQTPAFVQDYICLHELVHLREMNHASRFWRQVEQICPGFMRAERWLKEHSSLLR